MALTRKQALLNCKKMWQYIADEDCGKDKAVLDLWPDVNIPLNYCWACEFSKWNDVYAQNCTKCPVWDCEHIYDNSCLSGDYGKWCGSETKKQRKYYALKIVKLCDKKLEAYK